MKRGLSQRSGAGGQQKRASGWRGGVGARWNLPAQPGGICPPTHVSRLDTGPLPKRGRGETGTKLGAGQHSTVLSQALPTLYATLPLPPLHLFRPSSSSFCNGRFLRTLLLLPSSPHDCVQLSQCFEAPPPKTETECPSPPPTRFSVRWPSFCLFQLHTQEMTFCRPIRGDLLIDRIGALVRVGGKFNLIPTKGGEGGI